MQLIRLLSLACVLCISGCAGLARHIDTSSTAFYSQDFKPAGSIAVVAAEASVNNSLEFAVYKGKFENKLKAVGYQIVREPEQADFIALVAYGIDEGKSATDTSPVFGYIGGTKRYSSGLISDSVGLAAHSHTMPTYGVVGSSSRTVTSYTRTIALDIVEADSYKSGEPVKVYEGRTRSEGGCSVIVEVFDEMLEAMFTDFVGQNGRNRKLSVPAEYNC